MAGQAGGGALQCDSWQPHRRLHKIYIHISKKTVAARQILQRHRDMETPLQQFPCQPGQPRDVAQVATHFPGAENFFACGGHVGSSESGGSVSCRFYCRRLKCTIPSARSRSGRTGKASCHVERRSAVLCESERLVLWASLLDCQESTEETPHS